MTTNEKDSLAHYGTPRHSGRYPWGSGGNVATTQRNKAFLDHISELKQKGLSEVDIAKGLGMTVTQLRNEKSIAKNQEKQEKISQAQKLKDKGYSNVAIGERMGLNESSVRALLAPGAKDKLDVLHATANMLRQQVEEKGAIDVGLGTELHIGVSSDKLKQAVAVLVAEGYMPHKVKVPQLGTGKLTTIKVLARPDVSWSAMRKDPELIKLPTSYSVDGGRTFGNILPPISVSSRRLQVKYAEDGGDEADGVIYVRPGKTDISLGANRYAQVRIAVDGTHYIKGMAMYKDDLPAGTDLVFHTTKSRADLGPNKLDALKALKDDPENPFGSVVRQIGEYGEDGRIKKVTSAMNIVNEAGDWQGWKKSLATQVLSKQAPVVAKRQLDEAFNSKKAEFDEIMRLTNPTVKRKLLESFSDDADSSAVHMKAAAMPRQGSHVILPINSLKESEIYAPNYLHGERVALIRYPHGGIFEIPELVVNNNHREAKKLLGRATDAVGINHNVAKRLSGADFDGDTVLVIPQTRGRSLKTRAPLEGLKNFDPQREYPGYEGMPKMSNRTKQMEMGIVSNLITDMTIKGASFDEVARAVKHSMVVIDAEKHNLDYRKSARDNGILALKKKYQAEDNVSGRPGASTLISRAKSPKDVAERKQGFRIDPVTGKKVYTETGATYVDRKTGRLVVKTQRVSKLSDTDDAHTLSSGTKIEQVYADHSNRLKALANEARRESVAIKSIPWNPTAKRTYAEQVDSLDAKLKLALRNAPLERQAQAIGNSMVSAKRQANPEMDRTEIKKLNYLALDTARARLGAGKKLIDITPDEWAAIQAGAISDSRLRDILNNADIAKVKTLATPRTQKLMTSSKVAQAKAMAARGYTQAEIANALGVSLTTLKKEL